MNEPMSKITIYVPTRLLRHAKQYQTQHKLPSRSSVFREALMALREKELEESYRQAAEDFRRNPDPLVEDYVGELEPSDGIEWL